MIIVNHEKVAAVTQIVRGLPETEGMNFYSFKAGGREVPATNMYPPLHHPAAVEFFFFACLHNHGFWHGDANGYLEPMVGQIGGKSCKGSTLLWKSMARQLREAPESFCPERLAGADEAMMARMFRDDAGPLRFPEPEVRLDLTRDYGRWFQRTRLSPAAIVDAANKQLVPLAAFVKWVADIAGFKGDSWFKRPMLLAMILAARPERFLKVSDEENWRPIVDYHLMRVALRLGIVEITDEEVARDISERRWVSSDVERAIRNATYQAALRVMRASGRSLPVVDLAFWDARHFCPEMSEPQCDQCRFASCCAKRTLLFQPVFRTIDY
ncbi:MAG: queuosine salvage family protein [Patescibacteria group bacterium]|nr:queuosine salvage family protein [Patescibacteria group bacterium]